MNTPAPFFTIGIPNYGRPDYLREALDNIVSQSFTDFEVIVSDDCSPQDIEPIVREFSDTRIRWVRQEKNLGAVANFNYLIRHAQGRYIVLHQNDDLLHRDFLLRAHDAFGAHPEAMMYAASFWTGDTPRGFQAKIGIPVKTAAAILQKEATLIDGNFFATSLLTSLPITFPIIAISAEHWRAVGGYFSDYELGADQITLCRILIGNQLLYDPRIGGLYRTHASQTSRASAKKDKRHFHTLTLQQMIADLERHAVPWELLMHSHTLQTSPADLLAMLRESVIFRADPRLIRLLANALVQRQLLNRASQFFRLARKIKIRGLIYLLSCILRKEKPHQARLP